MKKKLIKISVFAAGMLLTGVVFAQTATTKPVKEAVIAAKIAKCDVIEKNVEKRTTNFAKQKEKHIAQYEKARARIVSLITKLEAAGSDVSKLKVDLVTFDDLIKKFASDYAIYIADLGETKTFTCGRSEGEFKAKLGIARAQLKVVHDDSVAIRTFWAKTIKPEVERIKGGIQ